MRQDLPFLAGLPAAAHDCSGTVSSSEQVYSVRQAQCLDCQSASCMQLLTDN